MKIKEEIARLKKNLKSDIYNLKSESNWLYQTNAGERIASSILNVVSQRQAEITSELSCERDWLFGMPRRLNIIGVSVDVGRDTSVVNPIDGDQSKIKKFVTLTLYNGSVNEHLTLDIPMGTITGVSGVKAIQISNQQGIEIHKIDKINITSILPILKQDPDVITDIQNSVNAGCEVIVPEKEITYHGFQGTGYIIQDSITGAGACLISGGAAGAQTLVTEGLYVALFEQFIKGSALVIEGEGEPSPLGLVGGWLKMNREQAMMAVGAAYFLNYNPIYMRITTVPTYLSEISKSDYKILYHTGHGRPGRLLLNNNPRVVITSTDIAGTSTSHFIFVYIDACHSVEGICQAFDSKASLSWWHSVSWNYSFWFEASFWFECIKNETIGESVTTARQIAKIITKLEESEGGFMSALLGDQSIILKRLVIGPTP